MGNAYERLSAAADEMHARGMCWRDCKAGSRPEQAGATFTRCCDPRVCHGWCDYITPNTNRDNMIGQYGE